MSEALAIARYHIVLVAMGGALTFGWLMTGRHLFLLTIVVAVDWFVINLVNRVTDIEEDLRNGIPGTERVARRKGLYTTLAATLCAGSFAATMIAWPALTPWRIAVQLIGLGYNYKIVPTPRGFSRFKEIYFLKNFGSAVLFILTCFVYPLAVAGADRAMPWPAVIAHALFFLLFEHTYEILYDFRDLDGDRALGVPTYPVVHGPAAARRIVDGLLLAAALVLAFALAAGLIGVREGLMLAAPATQFALYRPRLARGLTSRDCILITHAGTAQLALFLAGNAIWLRAGMPANIYLR